eukprot:TRINITY_DN1585_c2_g1_i1.p1 TRINITY_DN1585_c2_g1~~TRINITY_DN1585_c2_g1_i1.p1  ORF type:complete len:959 (+),score=234.78 TRINITY_DN1585_c2_g1_i1:344-2878(+)
MLEIREGMQTHNFRKYDAEKKHTLSTHTPTHRHTHPHTPSHTHPQTHPQTHTQTHTHPQTQNRNLSVSENCCLSIIMPSRSVDLVLANKEQRDLWLLALRIVIERANMQNKIKEEEEISFVLSVWQTVRHDSRNTVSFVDALRLLRRLNVSLSEEEVRVKFKEADTNGDDSLQFPEFVELLDALRVQPIISELYERIIRLSGKKALTESVLVDFLRTEQLETEGLEDAVSEIFSAFSPGSDEMTPGAFTNYMCSRSNSIFSPHAAEIYQDMDQPLSAYWIASSHNTYLERDQLQGNSSVDMYRRVLEAGCRCVEIDCWDGENGEIVVYHGRTLTSKITFLSVLETLRDHAFKKSPFPVILSLENHCSLANQAKMADILRSVFRESLAPVWHLSSSGSLPSPNELRFKFLVKGKINSTSSETRPMPTESRGAERPEISPKSTMNALLIHLTPRITLRSQRPLSESRTDSGRKLLRPLSRKVTPASPPAAPASAAVSPESTLGSLPVAASGADLASPASASSFMLTTLAQNESNPQSLIFETDEYDEDLPADKKKKSKPAAAQELSDITHLSSSAIKNLSESIATFKIHHMHSVSEGKVTALSKDNATQLVRFTADRILRVYPAGHRVDSSNYDPVRSWLCGAQLVALNYQTAGKMMDLNTGFFRDNGSSGYVLKPSDMLDTQHPFDPNKARNPVSVLRIMLVSGRQLPRQKAVRGVSSVISPSVRLAVRGLEADDREFLSRTVENNGFNPLWRETFDFPLCRPDLAVLSFTVTDEGSAASTMVGQYSLPVRCVRQGYRSVPLSDAQQYSIVFASLFVHVRFLPMREYLAEQHLLRRSTPAAAPPA